MKYELQRKREWEADRARILTRRKAQEERRRIVRKRRAIALGAVVVACSVSFFGAWGIKSTGGKKAVVKSTATETPAKKAAPARKRTPRPKEIRGVHVSLGTENTKARFASILGMADPRSGMNAIELDIKDERGIVGFASRVTVARASGAAQPYYEPRKDVRAAHARGLYVIGRIVVFQDDYVGKKYPDRAARTRSGGVWKTTQGHIWLNPKDRRNWAYAVALGKEAAGYGFDEILFDYVRFPSDGDVASAVFKGPKETHDQTITNFLTFAAKQLHPLGLRVSASIFGLAATNDLGIGQNPRMLRNVVDDVYPMAYPSLYGPNQYGIPSPVGNPHDTVAASLSDWQRKLIGGSATITPWLQAWNYTPAQIEAQISAARQAGTGGFLLWNAQSDYTAATLAAR